MMNKFANQMIDAYDDIYCEKLVKLASVRPETYIMTAEEKSRLHDDDYALCFITKEAQKISKFPIDSHDNAWLSNQYFPDTYHKLTKAAAVTAAQNIKKACAHFGIAPMAEVEKVASLVEREVTHNVSYEGDREDVSWLLDLRGHEKTAAEVMQPFADVEKIGDNYTHAQYILPTQAHVKLAAKFFDEKHEKIPLTQRAKYACAVQRRARELGMTKVGGAVEKYAGDNYGAHLDGHLASRRAMLDGRPELVGELNKLAAAKKEFTPQQFAQVLHGFDKKAGLSQYYGGYLANPFMATFAGLPDEGSSVRWMDKKGSRSLSTEEVRKLVNDSNTKIAEYFGSAMASELKKDPVSIFESLPNDAKEVLANIHDGLI